MKDKRIEAYFNHVTLAVTDLEGFTVPPDTAAVDTAALMAAHGRVRDAHRHLRKACRAYRRRLWMRRLVIWSEWRAVSMGYMRFDQVDKL